MRALKFTIPLLLIVAVSLLAISAGITGAALATSSNIANHTPVVQAEIPASNSTDLDRAWVEDETVGGAGVESVAYCVELFLTFLYNSLKWLVGWYVLVR